MSAKLEAFQVLARVMIDEGGKRLLGLAADVMTASGRDSLDPIHVVIAATSDEHASPRARAVLDALGINQAVARRFELSVQHLFVVAGWIQRRHCRRGFHGRGDRDASAPQCGVPELPRELGSRFAH